MQTIAGADKDSAYTYRYTPNYWNVDLLNIGPSDPELPHKATLFYPW